MLKPEHFYDPLHQRIYDAIERMWAKGHVVTPLTLKVALEQDPGLAEVGGQAYLVSLARAAPALPNVKDYARILADFAMRRELIRWARTSSTPHMKRPSTSRQPLRWRKQKRRFTESPKRALRRRPPRFRRRADSSGLVCRTGIARGGQISGVRRASPIWIRCWRVECVRPHHRCGPPGMGKTSLATNMAFMPRASGPRTRPMAHIHGVVHRC